MFYSSIANIAAGDNAPLDAGQSMAGAFAESVGTAMRGVFEGANNDSFDRPSKMSRLT
jgi:hypothetical protein